MRRLAILLGMIGLGSSLPGCGAVDPSDGPEPELPVPPFNGFEPWEWSLCEAGMHWRVDQCRGPAVDAGIPPEECAAGFEPLDDGCEPILPAAACAPGTMAVIGQTTCAPIADCGTGTWGNVPLENSTVHVNPAYVGVSNGSALSPWTTVAEALANAPSDAMVVLAQGSYPAVVIDAPVRLWGRCPDLVSVSSIVVNAPAELHRLHVGGISDTGVQVQAGPTRLEEMWISSTLQYGVLAHAETEIHRSLLEDNMRGAVVESSALTVVESHIRQGQLSGVIARPLAGGARSSLLVRRSIVESHTEIGIYVRGSDGVVEESVSRRHMSLGGSFGYGFALQPDNATGELPIATLRTSLIEDNTESGVYIADGTADISATVVRGTKPSDAAEYGNGIIIRFSDQTGGTSDVTVDRSVVSDNYMGAVFVAGARAEIRDSVMRDTRPQASDLRLGRGVLSQHVPGYGVTSVLVHDCLVLNNHDAGLAAIAAELIVERSLVVGTNARAVDGYFGHGIAGSALAGDPTPATLVVEQSLVEDNTEAGVAIIGGTMTMEDTRIRGTRSSTADSMAGVGVVFQGGNGIPETHGNVMHSWVHDNRGAGVLVYEAGAGIYTTLIERTLAVELDGTFGDGIVVTAPSVGASVAIQSGRIVESARAGIALFGGAVGALQGQELECNPISLNGEVINGLGPALANDGENVCGCGEEEEECKFVSSNLTPPGPLPAP